MQYLPQLKNLYRQQPYLRGRITVKFGIVESGKVIYCEIVESILNDPEFEMKIISIINKWVFPKIDTQVDTAEAYYPFVF